MRRTFPQCVLLLSIAFWVWGCGSESLTGPDGGGQTIENPSYQQDIQPIFDKSCVRSGCHDVASTAAGLVLTSYKEVMAGSDGGIFRVVIPGNAQDSELIMRLEGRSNRLSRQRMPFGERSLSSSEIQTIRNWIDKGAQNN